MATSGAFEAADHVLVTDIYAAREAPLPGVDSAELAAAIDNPMCITPPRWTMRSIT